MADFLQTWGTVVGSLGGFGVLILIAWKGGWFASWVRESIEHLRETVERIEKSFDDFEKENTNSHLRIHERINTKMDRE